MSLVSASGVVISGAGVLPPESLSDLEGDLRKRVRKDVPVPGAAMLFPARHPLDAAVPGRALRKVSDHTRLVTVASALALDDAGLRGGADAPVVGADDIGVCIGTSFGSSDYHLECHESLRRKGVQGASALLFSQSVFNAAPGHLGQVLKLMGGNAALVGGESVGLDAVHRAASRLRAGSPETAILAGGGEQYTDLVHASLAAAGLVGAERYGAPGVFAEGAAVCVVESANSAASRGAQVRAKVLGGASRSGSLDALPATAVRALATACQRSGIEPQDLGVVLVAPPAGRCAPDVMRDCGALGARMVSMAISEVGEGFSLSSAMLVADLALRALQSQTVPATHPDTAAASCLDEAVCPRDAREANLQAVAAVSMTSYGSVTALVLERPDS